MTWRVLNNLNDIHQLYSNWIQLTCISWGLLLPIMTELSMLMWGLSETRATRKIQSVVGQFSYVIFFSVKTRYLATLGGLIPIFWTQPFVRSLPFSEEEQCNVAKSLCAGLPTLSGHESGGWPESEFERARWLSHHGKGEFCNCCSTTIKIPWTHVNQRWRWRQLWLWRWWRWHSFPCCLILWYILIYFEDQDEDQSYDGSDGHGESCWEWRGSWIHSLQWPPGSALIISLRCEDWQGRGPQIRPGLGRVGWTITLVL